MTASAAIIRERLIEEFRSVTDESRAYRSAQAWIAPAGSTYADTKAFAECIGNAIAPEITGTNILVVNGMHNPTGGLPQNPLVGDAWIATAAANTWTTNRVYLWDGTVWVEIVPTEGELVWIESLGYYSWTGAAWVPISQSHAHDDRYLRLQSDAKQTVSGTKAIASYEANLFRFEAAQANALGAVLSEEGAPLVGGPQVCSSTTITANGYRIVRCNPTDANTTYYGIANHTHWQEMLVVNESTEFTVRIASKSSPVSGVVFIEPGTYAHLIWDTMTEQWCAETQHDTRYSLLSHLHDERYAVISHLHDGRYSILGHLHDDRYSLLGHNHDGSYSPINHNHSSAYAVAHSVGANVLTKSSGSNGFLASTLADSGTELTIVNRYINQEIAYAAQPVTMSCRNTSNDGRSVIRVSNNNANGYTLTLYGTAATGTIMGDNVANAAVFSSGSSILAGTYLNGSTQLWFGLDGVKKFGVSSDGNLETKTNLGIGTINNHLTQGWLIETFAQAISTGDINGIKLHAGYSTENTKWAGIAARAADTHSNTTVLDFFAQATQCASLRIDGFFASGYIVAGGYIDCGSHFYHKANLAVFNNDQDGWVTWATRDTSGTEARINLSNLGSISLLNTVTMTDGSTSTEYTNSGIDYKGPATIRTKASGGLSFVGNEAGVTHSFFNGSTVNMVLDQGHLKTRNFLYIGDVSSTNPLSPLHVKYDPGNGGRIARFYSPSMGNSENIYLHLGKAESTNNVAEISYYHTSDGSSSNELRLGLYGNPDLLRIQGGGTSIFKGWVQLGDLSSSSTATPMQINMGGSYSSTAGANPKLKLWSSGSEHFGIGVSSSQMDFMVPSGTQTFAFWTGGTKIGYLNSAGMVLGNSTSSSTATPLVLWLGNTYSNGTTRDKCKLYLYNTGNEQYGFGMGANGDIQYHSNVTHDFYVDNSRKLRLSSDLMTSALSVMIGNTTSSSTSSPATLNLGGTFSSTAGANAKLRVYDDGTYVYGLGVSNLQMDYMVPSGQAHSFYVSSTKSLTVTDKDAYSKANYDYSESSTYYNLTSFNDKKIYVHRVGSIVFVRYYIYARIQDAANGDPGFTLPYTATNDIAVRAAYRLTQSGTPSVQLMIVGANSNQATFAYDQGWTSNDLIRLAGEFFYHTTDSI